MANPKETDTNPPEPDIFEKLADKKPEERNEHLVNHMIGLAKAAVREKDPDAKQQRIDVMHKFAETVTDRVLHDFDYTHFAFEASPDFNFRGRLLNDIWRVQISTEKMFKNPGRLKKICGHISKDYLLAHKELQTADLNAMKPAVDLLNKTMEKLGMKRETLPAAPSSADVAFPPPAIIPSTGKDIVFFRPSTNKHPRNK